MGQKEARKNLSGMAALHQHLRYALNHLYEPDILRASPLVRLLVPDDQAHLPMALNRVLTQAIESLKPKPGTSPGSPAWRIYELLFYRYVHCATQADLAHRLGVSVRQLRREQSNALDVLAESLSRQHDLSEAILADLNQQEEEPQTSQQKTDALARELQWMAEGVTAEAVNLHEELGAIQDIVKPLLVQYRVRLEVVAKAGLPVVVVPITALRQATLNILTIAIHRASPGKITLSAVRRGWQLYLSLHALPDWSNATVPTENHDTDNLKDAMGLLRLCGGTLNVAEEQGVFIITIGLPIQESVPVLVIDDNPDALQLLERYAVATRYRLINVREPEHALSVAEKEKPALIVLDIMMSGLDGWELLQRFRAHPLTAPCPIIVCSVLAQKELALAQGAQEYVRKPVNRQAFLQALDRQYAKLVQVP
ncbi:MAG: hybrid sensor histidine kinase/response regulator [Anaerolineae bacterium]|nr:hybrid sensor histidine kinase/response regulator [Anaerolineae bacterium]